MARPIPDTLELVCAKCRSEACFRLTLPDVKTSRFFHIYDCDTCGHETWIRAAPQ